MNPQTPPDASYVGRHSQAIQEIRLYGSYQAHKPSIMDVGLDWQHRWSLDGLPESWFYDHDGLVDVRRDGPDAGTWRLYVRQIGTLFVGLAESLDGQALRFLGLTPRGQLTRQQYVEQMRARLGGQT